MAAGWEERGRALRGISKQSVNQSIFEHDMYMYKSWYSRECCVRNWDCGASQSNFQYALGSRLQSVNFQSWKSAFFSQSISNLGNQPFLLGEENVQIIALVQPLTLSVLALFLSYLSGGSPVSRAGLSCVAAGSFSCVAGGYAGSFSRVAGGFILSCRGIKKVKKHRPNLAHLCSHLVERVVAVP